MKETINSMKREIAKFVSI